MHQHTEVVRHRLDPLGREVDALDRVAPHQLNVIGLARAVPGLLSQFAETLPVERWRRYRGSVRIKCPCQGEEQLPPSQRPSVEPGRLRACDDCDRVYLFTGKDVRIAYAAPREQRAA